MRQSPRHPLRRCLTALAAAAVTSLALQVPQGFADDTTRPTLTQGPPGAVASGGIANLRDALLELRAGKLGSDHRPEQQRQRDALHSALRQLSSQDRVASAPAPRLGRIDHTSAGAEPHDLAALAASLLAVRQDVPVATTDQAGSVVDLRRAMGRFPTVTDTLLSDTFSGVLLGLADIEPTLSDGLMMHPTIDKQALRERVVESRLPTTGPVATDLQLARAAPRLGQPSPQPALAVTRLPADDDGMLVGLDQPMDALALGGTLAAPPADWDGIGSPDEGMIAMEDTVDLDLIDLDELGTADIASAAAPVAIDDLQETRAGFLLDNGVKIDFAVTKLTSVSGLDQLHTITRLPDSLDPASLGQISVGQFANKRVLSPNGGSMVTLIQNDLDNQHIVDITKIDIGIKNLGLKTSDFLRSTYRNIEIPAELRR